MMVCIISKKKCEPFSGFFSTFEKIEPEFDGAGSFHPIPHETRRRGGGADGGGGTRPHEGGRRWRSSSTSRRLRAAGDGRSWGRSTTRQPGVASHKTLRQMGWRVDHSHSKMKCLTKSGSVIALWRAPELLILVSISFCQALADVGHFDMK